MTMLTLPRLLGRTFLVTVGVDLALLGALLGAPLSAWLWPGALAALFAMALAVHRLSAATRVGELSPPWHWPAAALLLPVSTFVAARRGLWAGAHPQARLRLRLGTTALLVTLALFSTGRQVDAYASAAGLAEVDRAAAAYLDASLEKASLMLLTVATLNGAISVLKSFDISIGVGISLGEALDPIDDLVETLSWVMAASTASLVAQRLLLEIGNAIALPALLTMGLVLLALVAWLPVVGVTAALARLGQRLIWAALLVRLVIPVIAATTDYLSTRFLDQSLSTARAEVEGVTTQLADESDELRRVGETLPTAAPASLWTTLRETPGNLSSLLTKLNVAANIQAAKQRLAALAAHLVRLIALLLLQTILLPLLVAWALWRTLGLLAGDPPAHLELDRPRPT